MGLLRSARVEFGSRRARDLLTVHGLADLESVLRFDGEPQARGGTDVGDPMQRKVLLLEEGHCLRDQALAVCQSAKTDEFRASSLATVVQMVANGYGITILPALSLSTEVGHLGPIAVVPFTEPAPSRTIGLAWRRSSPHEDEFAELGRFIQERFVPPPA